MYNYIQRHGETNALELYGPEGDAVIRVYQESKDKARVEVERAMLTELKRQLPSARENKRLMHVNERYVVFDVSMNSFPTDKHELFISAAKRHAEIYRFLGPDEGEREAFHFEIEK